MNNNIMQYNALINTYPGTLFYTYYTPEFSGALVINSYNCFDTNNGTGGVIYMTPRGSSEQLYINTNINREQSDLSLYSGSGKITVTNVTNKNFTCNIQYSKYQDTSAGYYVTEYGLNTFNFLILIILFFIPFLLSFKFVKKIREKKIGQKNKNVM